MESAKIAQHCDIMTNGVLLLDHTGSKIFWLLIFGHIRWKGQVIPNEGGRKGYQCDQNHNLIERWFHCVQQVKCSVTEWVSDKVSYRKDFYLNKVEWTTK